MPRPWRAKGKCVGYRNAVAFHMNSPQALDWLVSLHREKDQRSGTRNKYCPRPFSCFEMRADIWLSTKIGLELELTVLAVRFGCGANPIGYYKRFKPRPAPKGAHALQTRIELVIREKCPWMVIQIKSCPHEMKQEQLLIVTYTGLFRVRKRQHRQSTQ